MVEDFCAPRKVFIYPSVSLPFFGCVPYNFQAMPINAFRKEYFVKAINVCASG